MKCDEPVFEATQPADSGELPVSSRRRHESRLPVDRLLNHRYRVIRAIGAGGMGTVHLCEDEKLRRFVAIKQLFCEGEELAEERLLQEARALAQFGHPNVVSVYDLERGDQGQFLVMEYLAGRNAAVWVRSQPSVAEIIDVYRQAGEGLAAIHEAGFVHWDIKPQNIVVGDDGRVCVVDLGLASPHCQQARPAAVALNCRPSMLSDRRIEGTIDYIAPERQAGNGGDERSDQFSFAVSLAATLSLCPAGRIRRAGSCRAERQTFEQELLDRDVPRHVVEALIRATYWDPKKRFSDMRALLEAIALPLEPRSRPLIAPFVGSALAPSAGGQVRPERHRFSRLNALGGIAVALALTCWGANGVGPHPATPTAAPRLEGRAVASSITQRSTEDLTRISLAQPEREGSPRMGSMIKERDANSLGVYAEDAQKRRGREVSSRVRKSRVRKPSIRKKGLRKPQNYDLLGDRRGKFLFHYRKLSREWTLQIGDLRWESRDAKAAKHVLNRDSARIGAAYWDEEQGHLYIARHGGWVVQYALDGTSLVERNRIQSGIERPLHLSVRRIRDPIFSTLRDEDRQNTSAPVMLAVANTAEIEVWDLNLRRREASQKLDTAELHRLRWHGDDHLVVLAGGELINVALPSFRDAHFQCRLKQKREDGYFSAPAEVSDPPGLVRERYRFGF